MWRNEVWKRNKVDNGIRDTAFTKQMNLFYGTKGVNYMFCLKYGAKTWTIEESDEMSLELIQKR